MTFAGTCGLCGGAGFLVYADSMQSYTCGRCNGSGVVTNPDAHFNKGEFALKKCDGNHGGPPCQDPECWAREDLAGLVVEVKPLVFPLMPDEADYVARLVAADEQRMTEARDHGISHGMRGYLPPDLQRAQRIGHSLNMARTAAAIEAMELIEAARADIAEADASLDTPEK